MIDKETLLRKARLHRNRGGRWDDFFAEYGEAIDTAAGDRRERARLVDALQSIVLLGIGEPVEVLS